MTVGGHHGRERKHGEGGHRGRERKHGEEESAWQSEETRRGKGARQREETRRRQRAAERGHSRGGGRTHVERGDSGGDGCLQRCWSTAGELGHNTLEKIVRREGEIAGK
ncbi:hypothetical protein Adt_02294 [Abeliophyllum distichum]|uniref:Uncharacterized protein n=1 Tax=Abeliophyllum distichum TaxID=126358 RepID=A0ABD1VVD9_9LAMI